MRSVVVILSIGLFFPFVASRQCMDHNLCQCIASPPWKIKITCRLEDTFDRFIFTESNITSLEIRNASMRGLHESMFLNIKLKKLKLSNFRLNTVSQPEWHKNFIGIKGTLEQLEIYNSFLDFPWNFDVFELIARLTHLTIVKSIFLYHSDITLNHLSYLLYIEIRECRFHRIDNNIFRDLSNLHLISLSRSNIHYIKRDMFPQFAKKLWHIDLSYNLIEYLPDDIFRKMPKLREVRLDHNKLRVLQEDIFLSLIKRGQLKELWIHDNLLTCDKNLCWMAKAHLSVFTLFECCRIP